MITREETFEYTPDYPAERLGNPDEITFFDIETTGLSADKNQVYMIGVLACSGDKWKLTQWLSGSPDSEVELLDAFFSYLKDFRILISFNGETFDIPFLQRRCRVWDLGYDFSDIKSVDILKRIRPYRNILGLENCRQKSIEHFLGIDREDIYTGGELINVYMQYLYTKDDSYAAPLLLHNTDDLRGMPKILSILSYPDLFGSPLCLKSSDPVVDNGNDDPFLTLRCESEVSVPVPVSPASDPFFCDIDGDSVTIYIRLLRGTLKHYFQDPENYYYLICEDMAVHKSVGRYVAREARRQATSKTCYVKQEGLFMPQFDGIWEPVMKDGRNDKMSYALLDNVSFDDLPRWNEFSRKLLRWLGPGRSS